MGEFDSERTYALRKLQFALVDPKGQPLSLHPSIDTALGAWVQSRGGIILSEDDRQRYFAALNKAHYKICTAFAWCRVDQASAISKLKKEKGRVAHDGGGRPKAAKPARHRETRAGHLHVSASSSAKKRSKGK